MKKIIVNFLKSKLNIALLTLQILAIILFALGNLAGICFVLGVVLEGVFFILLGIKIIFHNKRIFEEFELAKELPYSEKELEQQKKKTYEKIKNNRFISIVLIIMGVILIFTSFSYLV